MAVIVNWNGVDVPEELKALKKGRYVLVPVDDPPALTEEQEAGLEAALASLRAGEGLSLDEAYAKAKASLEWCESSSRLVRSMTLLQWLATLPATIRALLLVSSIASLKSSTSSPKAASTVRVTRFAPASKSEAGPFSRFESSTGAKPMSSTSSASTTNRGAPSDTSR